MLANNHNLPHSHMSEKQYLTIAEIIARPRLSSPRISDDGQKIAYVQRQTDWDGNSYLFHVWIYENGKTYPLTQGKDESTSPQWSPDSQSLAYLAKVNDKDKKKQIFVKRDGEFTGTQVSYAPEGVSNFKWSSSGDGFFFIARETEDKAIKKRRDKYGDFEYVDREFRCDCLFYVDLNTGVTKTQATLTLPKDLREPNLSDDEKKNTPETDEIAVRLTPGKSFHVYSFDISPQGHQVIFTAAPSSLLEDKEKIDIYLLDTVSKEYKKLPIDLIGSKHNVKFSPNGKLACFTYYPQGKWFKNLKIAMIDLETHEINTNLSIDIDESVYPFRWLESGLFCWWQHRTNSYVGLVNLQGEITHLVGDNNSYIHGASISGDGKHIAYLKANPQSCYELYLDNQCLTNTSKILENRAFAQKQVITWVSSDNTEIEGVLITPHDFDSTTKYPLLVNVHGGPRSASLPIPLGEMTYPLESFIAKGFIILQPNYRGSSGYGENFSSLNYRNLGIGDFEDVMSGVNYLIDQGFVDSERIGIMGWSQGGYISAFCATHTNKFKAVSVGAGISNWVTYYVSTDIPTFTRYYLGDTPWNDPEIYQKTSPMSLIKSASTPTLIQHGDGDKRVPVSNAYELYQGLQDVGVETELVIFKNMAHGSNKPGLNRAIMTQNLIWFCHYLLGESKDDFYLR